MLNMYNKYQCQIYECQINMSNMYNNYQKYKYQIHKGKINMSNTYNKYQNCQIYERQINKSNIYKNTCQIYTDVVCALANICMSNVIYEYADKIKRYPTMPPSKTPAYECGACKHKQTSVSNINVKC